MGVFSLDSKFTPLLCIEELIKAINKVDNYKRFCSEQVSEIDKMIKDDDHCLELMNLDCIKQSQLSKIHKEHLIKRRFYKDEIEYINALERSGFDTQNIANGLKKLKSSFEETKTRLDNRMYTPRCLFELFGLTPEDATEAEECRKDKRLLGKNANRKTLRMESKFRQVSKQ